MSPASPLRLTLLAASLLAASCSSDGNQATPAAAVVQQVGPTGAVLTGAAGTPLQGLQITIPKDALEQLVEVRVEPADPVRLDAHQPVSAAFEIRMSPDPGRLLAAMEMRVQVEVPRFRAPDDFVLVRADELPDAPTRSASALVTTARTSDGLSSDGRYFRAQGVRAGRYQVLLSEVPRALTDAVALLAKGLGELESFERRSFENALAFCQQALQADPHLSEARFYAALCRLALLLDDRSDTSAGVDSLGELLEAYGVRLGSRGVLERLFADEWPLYRGVPQSAPGQEAVRSFWATTLRPALVEIRNELLRVGDDLQSSLRPPDFFRVGTPARRELDFGDLAIARALVEGMLGAGDYVLSYDWDEDPDRLAAVRSGADLLQLATGFGLQSVPWLERAGEALGRGLGHYAEAHRAIERETDAQDDDVLVFHSSLDAGERDALLADVLRLQRSLRDESTESLRIGRQAGRLSVRPSVLFAGAGVAWRSLLPQFRAWAPLGSTLPDPTAGGLFPGLTRSEAIQRASIPTEADVLRGTIRIDGDPSDWPAGSALLVPADPAGDDSGELRGVDLAQLHAVLDGDFVYFRIDLAFDDVILRPGIVNVYQIRGADLATRRGDGTPFRLEIRFDGTQPVAKFAQGEAAAQDVPFAYSGRSLECAVPRRLVAGERELRHVSVRSYAFDRGSAARGEDRTRDVVVRF